MMMIKKTEISRLKTIEISLMMMIIINNRIFSGHQVV
jgi:hypothetical protein